MDFETTPPDESHVLMHSTGYQSSFPVRPGTVVTILNLPPDLSKAEAERLAQFVRMLALE